MVKVQDFNASNFEQNLSNLGERIKERNEQNGFEKAPERERVKQSLRDFAAQPPIVAVGQTEDDQKPLVKDERFDFLPNYIGTERESDVLAAIDMFVNLALHGDLLKAVREARKRLPPFLVDVFHDALTDKILPPMKERGLF